MSNKKDAYIVYAKRTPIGKLAGALSSVRVDDLLAVVFKDLKSSLHFDTKEIDDVIVGCANQAGEDNRNVARMSLLLADFPYEVPGSTVNRLCGSSLDALISAWAKIEAGFGDCFVVGGVEGMSRAPYSLEKAENAFSGDQKIYNTALGWRFPNVKMIEKFPLLSMGETAEEINLTLKISREQQDQFAYESHQKALNAQKNSLFNDEIIPVTIYGKKNDLVNSVSVDEGPRAETSLEKLATLKPVFRKNGTVTAGNSSTLNDGASAVLLVSEAFMKRHNLKPLARVSGFGVKGRHPSSMGLGPVDATKNLCQKFNKKISDFNIIELNEAFAVQALGCISELKLDPAKVNLKGGAIALGHPLGCSGTRIITTLAHQMKKDSKLKQGLATMCIGVGQGIAVSLENTI